MKHAKKVFLFVCIFLCQSVQAHYYKPNEEIFSQYFKPTIDCTWLAKCNVKKTKKEDNKKFRFQS